MRAGEARIFWVSMGLFLFVLASLIMMSFALHDAREFSRHYDILLISNLSGLLLLILLIGLNFRYLFKQRRDRVAGSQLTVRMVITFTALAVTPILILYTFSINFLYRGVDSWYDLRMERALDDSLALSRLALDIRMRELLTVTSASADELAKMPSENIPFELGNVRARIAAEELILLDRAGDILSSSAAEPGRVVPTQLDELVLFQLQRDDSYIGLDSLGRNRLVVRVAINIPGADIEGGGRIMQALFPIPTKMGELSASVQAALVKHKELSYLHENLKISLVIVLTLVLLFSIFSAVWAAFYSARRISKPVHDLAKGTQAVARGEYHTRLPISNDDELGFLVSSFNQMTDRIARARDTARHNQREAETQHNYLETILSQLSSGVLVFDARGLIQRANISAARIMGQDIDGKLGLPPNALCADNRKLDEFVHLLETKMREHPGGWRAQIAVPHISHTQHLMVSGTEIAMPERSHAAYVLVIDDITALVKGQRDAAWSEIARRLAHEIKNPLTPIQLAAERLRHKYLDSLGPERGQPLDSLTNTIIQQVDTLKIMVNNFSDYARPIGSSLEPMHVGALIEEVVDLYANPDRDSTIKKDLQDVPQINGDPNKLRQVFNNIIKNALDANRKTGNTTILISCKHVRAERSYVEICVRDNGLGIDENKKNKVFEPYVTYKKKGTGLGLAIVKKIIEEHSGQIWLENHHADNGAVSGARVVMRLLTIIQDTAA